MRMSRNNLISFVCGGIVCLTACISLGSDDAGKVREDRPVVSSMTVSPEVPSAVPLTWTPAPMTGSPEVSVTVPEMVIVSGLPLPVCPEAAPDDNNVVISITMPITWHLV